MNKQDNQDYVSAMRILDELCVRHKVECTEKVRELFWRGVLLGQNREKSAQKRMDVPLTEKEPPRSNRTIRRDSAGESRRPSDPGKSGFQNDLGEAVSFRL